MSSNQLLARFGGLPKWCFLFNYEQTFVYAFVSSHLDYCNSLFSGVPQKSINRLFQNSAARVELVSRNILPPFSTHCTGSPYVMFRIDFNIVFLVSKSLSSLSPSYITDLLNLYTPACTLRSKSDYVFCHSNTSSGSRCCKVCLGLTYISYLFSNQR